MKTLAIRLMAVGVLLSAVSTLAVAQQGATPAPATPPAGAAPAAGGGQPPAPPARGPSLDLAIEAAQTAIATCTANGYKVGASVVDSAGVLKVLLAADGAAKMGVETSTRKAVTANTFKTASSDIQNRVTTDTALAAKINADPTLFARAGAVPLMVGNDFIGAIGVGGAPGGDKDEMCAVAGRDKIKDRLK